MSMEPTEIIDVVIIGGGITGLSLAYYLQKDGGNALGVAIVESSERLGGKIRTDCVKRGGLNLLMEIGPDSILLSKPAIVNLATDLDLAGDFIRPQASTFYILRKKKLRVYPSGMASVLPTKFWPFAISPLLSIKAKLRMAFEPFIKIRTAATDESVGDFITRRLGSEALDYLAEPLLSGIYGADPWRQSMKATFPQLLALEKQHGSLVKGMLRQVKTRKSGPAFVSLKNGLQSFSDALIARLSCRVEIKTSIELVSRVDDLYAIKLNSGETIFSKTLIFTSLSDDCRKLINSLTPELSALANMRTVSSGFIYLAYRKTEISLPIGASGVLIPKKEGRLINAITFSSNKYPGRCSDDHCLLRVFFGGSRNLKMVDLSDAELMTIVQSELKEILDISATPVYSQLGRLRNAQPQYDVGHLEWVASITAACPPGLFLTGSNFLGSGLPDCVEQAWTTATEVRKYLH